MRSNDRLDVAPLAVAAVEERVRCLDPGVDADERLACRRPERVEVYGPLAEEGAMNIFDRKRSAPSDPEIQ